MTLNTRVKVEASDVEVKYTPQIQKSFLGFKYWKEIEYDDIFIADILIPFDHLVVYSQKWAEALCLSAQSKYQTMEQNKQKEARHRKTKTVEFYKFP